jgi:hypothetical protein
MTRCKEEKPRLADLGQGRAVACFAVTSSQEVRL